jgi:protein-tyrosine phosphatase/arsenate reductase
MFPKIRQFTQSLEDDFKLIPTERKALLQKITGYIQERYNQNMSINLVYICTHNSRRSHFGQVAAALAASFYNIESVSTFSGGTEATTFNPNAIQALKNIGFEISSDGKEVNPIYEVFFGKNLSTTCFSKVYDDEGNPKLDFAAIMTCSDAEQNCPFILGATLRIGTTYEDPKKSDGTPQQDETYLARFRQIATETLYAFSLVR